MHELKLNLKPLMKKLEIFTKKKVMSELSGGYTSAFIGAGLDFDGYREYSPSDDASAIDWKASLRAQDILVKKFTEERSLNVVFVVDVSSSMSYASVEKLKNEYAAELVASLAFATIQSGDSAGLVMFSDKIVKSIYPSMGPKQYFAILSALSNPANYDGQKNYEKMTAFLMNFLKRGCIVIIISDFIGLGAVWEKSFELLSNKFELLGIMVRDPNDNVLPEEKGQVVFSDPFSDEELLISPSVIRGRYQEEVISSKAMLNKIFSKTRSGFLELSTDKPFVSDVAAFFKRRQKK